MDEEFNAVTCFATRNLDSMNQTMDYLIDELGLNDATGIKIKEDYFIVVLKENYKKAVVLGNQYITKNNIHDMFWIDPYGKPIKCGYLNVCYMQFPDDRKGNALWGIDDYLPKDIYHYLKEFKQCFGVGDFVFQEYFSNDYENGFHITVRGMDYNKYMNDIVKFIRFHGFGPFSSIVPMTQYGAFMEEDYKKLTKK